MKPNQKNNNIRKILFPSLIVFMCSITVLFASLKIWFRSDIRQISDYAITKYEGQKMECLVLLALDTNQDLKLRNQAIWALGKIRNSSSVRALKTLQTGQPCDHKSRVCQQELEKAINTLEGNQIDLFTFRE